MKDLPQPRLPVSTYRLQFNQQFRFSDANNIISYLHYPGITDIYASLYFKAKEGNLQGYDIVDPNSLNSEVGSESDYNEMIKEIKTFNIGQILDIVPNHMGIANSDNLY